MLFSNNLRYMQYAACLTATLSVTMNGMLTSWSSPSIPKLRLGDTPLDEPVTVEEGSWIASLILLTPIALTYHSNWLLEKYGRKFSLLFSAIPIVISWTMIIFAKSVVLIFIARIIGGASIVFIGTTVPIYIGEVAEKDIRGKLGSAYNLMKVLGYIIALSVGPFVSFTTLNCVCVGIPIIFFLVFYKMPESPYFLVKKGKIEEARLALILLSQKNIQPSIINKKMLEIEETVANDMKNKLSWSAVLRKEYRIPFIIIFGVKTLQQFSGLLAIDSYMQTILEASNTNISSEIFSIVYGVIQVPAVILAAVTVDKVGRKPILLISSIGCALALIAEGIFFYLKDYLNEDVSNLSWLPVTGLVIYVVLNNFGLCTIPYILMGELFTTNIKELACTITIAYSCALTFLVTKFYEPVSVSLGRYTMFWFFAACCILGAVFVHFVLPETKGKTFNEIQEKLNRKKGETV